MTKGVSVTPSRQLELANGKGSGNRSTREPSNGQGKRGEGRRVDGEAIFFLLFLLVSFHSQC